MMEQSKNTRQEKVARLISRLAARFFEEERERGLFISVTNCNISKNLKKSTIFITIFPEEKEEVAFNLIKENIKSLRQYLGQKMHIKFVPAIDVQIDKGEKARQRIEEISKEL